MGCFKLQCQKRFLNKICKMRSRKSEGPDGVHPGFLKECRYQCESVTCHLKSISFLEKQKATNVTPFLSCQGRFGEL